MHPAHHPHASRVPLGTEVAVIALGGGVGSVLRYALARAMPPLQHGFPTATLLTNLLGSLLLGALVVGVTEVSHAHPLLRPALGTGLLGGFTTFSTFAVETRGLSAAEASGYVAASLIGGIVLAFIGMELVRIVERSRLTIADEDEIDPIDPDLP